MTSTDIRPVRLDELPALEQLAHRIWHAHYPGIITVAQIDYMLASGYKPSVLEGDLADGTRIDVVMRGNAMIGFMAYGPCVEEDGKKNVKLHKCYLDVDEHGRGLGQRMLNHVAGASREIGAQTLTLQVNKENKKAIQAYKRRGFVVTEAVVDDIGNGFVMDDYIMSLALH